MTENEESLLEGAPDSMTEAVLAIKDAFGDIYQPVLVDVCSISSWRRRQVAHKIRRARWMDNCSRATLLRDTWRERVATCVVDGNLLLEDAQLVAYEEVISI